MIEWPIDWRAVVDEAIRRRKAEGLTQRSLAALAGVSAPTVNSFEQGDINLRFERVVAILDALGLFVQPGRPSSSMFAAGPAYAKLLIDAGFPEPGRDDHGFWKQYSLALNADRIAAPILIQLPDDEYRLGLETFETLKRHHVPVEMYVFKDEYHQKWHPAHRLAGYERVIDWFDYWLNGGIDDRPGMAAQYARWRALGGSRKR